MHGVAVEHHVADVHILGRQRHVVAVGRRAHGEEESAAHHEVAYLVAHRQLELTHLLVTQLMGAGLLVFDILDVPLCVAVVAPEFAVLAREVLMVQVQPVVGGQHAGHHLFVVDDVVGYLRIGHHQRDGVVPRQLALGRVDGNLGCLVQLHGIHVDCGVGNLREDGRRLAVGDGLDRHPPQAGFALQGVGIFHHEGAAAVVEQPGHLDVALQGIVGYAIGFEVVALRLIHGDK